MGNAEYSETAARGAESLTDVLARFEHDGYAGQFRVVDAGKLQCLTCRAEVNARAVQLERLQRLEGASDPADMLGVAALRCPNCGTRGTVVLNYGPEATLDDAEVLIALDDERSRPD